VTDLVFVGTGGQARELHAITEALGGAWTPIGFLDDDPSAANLVVHGLPVLGGIDWLEARPGTAVAVGIGSPATRRKIVERIRALGPRGFPTLVHPTASIGPRVALGEGVVVCPGVVVTTDVAVGDHVLLNFGCTVGHDVVVGEFAAVAPGAHISGRVRLGEGSDVGTGASIIQGLSIGEWSVVGAGAAVVDDVAPNTTVGGVPARVTRTREPGWHLEET
jgi:sugar O-acyltransferase (sialic acid O-acetyltransferase NeuD family)